MTANRGGSHRSRPAGAMASGSPDGRGQHPPSCRGLALAPTSLPATVGISTAWDDAAQLDSVYAAACVENSWMPCPRPRLFGTYLASEQSELILVWQDCSFWLKEGADISFVHEVGTDETGEGEWA